MVVVLRPLCGGISWYLIAEYEEDRGKLSARNSGQRDRVGGVAIYQMERVSARVEKKQFFSRLVGWITIYLKYQVAAVNLVICRGPWLLGMHNTVDIVRAICVLHSPARLL